MIVYVAAKTSKLREGKNRGGFIMENLPINFEQAYLEELEKRELLETALRAFLDQGGERSYLACCEEDFDGELVIHRDIVSSVEELIDWYTADQNGGVITTSYSWDSAYLQ